MKALIVTTAAAALLAPLAVQAADEKTKAASTEIEVEAEMSDANIGVVYMQPDEMSVKEFLGEGVIGIDGERIARVDDILIGADGKADSVIFLSGGFFGLGGKKGALDYSALDLTLDNEHEPAIRVSMSEDAIQNVAEFKTDELNDYRLASELVGAAAELSGTDESAVIADAIVSKDGDIRHLIVADGVIGSWGGEKRAVAYNKLVIEQGDGGLVLNMTPEQFETAQKFEYRHGQHHGEANAASKVDD